MRKVSVIPSAHRLMQSLRDIGYEFSTAVADIVDNSLAAGATAVWIDYEFEGVDTWIRIADNGSGMRPAAMDEALRFGTRRDYEEIALGKFGLGLKTASISQCQRLTVASRTEGGRTAIRVWDLEHIEKTDAWELLHPAASECHLEATAPLKRGAGTVVFWQKLERVLGYQIPAGKAAQTGFMRMCKELEGHLGAVFHRYLSGEAKRKLPLKIFVNGHQVEPWDPFCRQETHTQALSAKTIPFAHETVKSYINVQPFVLPHESQFSSGRAFREAGRGQWNSLQGFYIYRNDRLLQAGGWNRIRSLDEHVKLARIAIDFPPSADAAFSLNVTKMGISFPAEVREQLGKIVRDVTGRAQDVYRKRGNAPQGNPTPTTPAGTGPRPAGPRTPGTPSTSSGSGTQETPGTGSPPTGRPTTGTPNSTNTPQPTTPNGGTPPTGTQTEPPGKPPQSLALQVVRVLRQELSDDPDLLSRLLDALSSLDPEFARNMQVEREVELA